MDKVLVRIQGSRGKLVPKRRLVVEGTIVKKGKNSDNYQVIVQMPYTNEKGKKWFSVEDITNVKTMQKMNRQRKTRNEWMEKMTMPITIWGKLD